MHSEIEWENLKGRDNLRRLDVDGRIIPNERSGLYGRCSNGVPLIHFFQTKQNSNQILPHAISGLFQP
jgi:hypothetical protein